MSNLSKTIKLNGAKTVCNNLHPPPPLSLSPHPLVLSHRRTINTPHNVHAQYCDNACTSKWARGNSAWRVTRRYVITHRDKEIRY